MEPILVVDDEEILRMLIVDSLEEEGYEIDEACDGKQALEKIKEKNYKLIILDYMMPGMTGMEVMKQIRAEYSNEEIKILMLTAKAQKQDIEIAYETGASYFLAKPFSPIELIELVEDLLNE